MEQLRTDQHDLEQAIYEFYNNIYDQYIRLDELDLSDVMALAYPESHYTSDDILQGFEERKKAVKEGTALPFEKLPYRITVLSYACTNGWGDAYVDLTPLAERTEPVYQDYLDRYPAFMHFGPNQLYFRKMNGKWKVYSTSSPSLKSIGILDNILWENAIRELYWQAWESYIGLDYWSYWQMYNWFLYGEGWETITEKSGFSTALIRDALQADIERWKKEQETAPEKGVPEKLPYEMHILKSPVKPLTLKGDDRYEIVCAKLIPAADREAGMSDEDYLSQYPSFMNFEELYYLFKKESINGQKAWVIVDIQPEAELLKPAE